MDLTLTADARSEWRRSWDVVAVSSVGMAVATIYIHSMGLFIAPLEAEFGWSRSQITLGLMIVSVTSVVVAPFVGLLIDRMGPRRVALPGIAIYCGAIALLSIVGPSIYGWWAIWTLVACGSVCIKPTVWTAAVASLFTSARGLAFAITLVGSSLGAAIFPYMTEFMLSLWGWRSAYLIFGLGSAALLLPLAFLFFYEADHGSRKGKMTRSSVPCLTGVTIRDGLRSRQFALLACAALLLTGSITALTVHFVPIMTGMGMSRSAAAGISGLIGISSVFGRLGSGYLLDRMDGRVVGAVMFTLPAFACLLLLGASGSPIQSVTAALVLGLALGSEVDVMAYLCSRYFGMRHYGVIFGTIAGLFSLGAGVGPLFSATIYDATGSYRIAMMVLIPVVLLTSACIAALGPMPKFGNSIGR